MTTMALISGVPPWACATSGAEREGEAEAESAAYCGGANEERAAIDFRM